MYCPSCNHPNPAYVDDYCGKCGLAMDGSGRVNPIQRPSAPVYDPNLPTGASFWIRAAAQVLDMVPHYLAIVFAVFFAAFIVGFYAAATHQNFELMWANLNPANLSWWLSALAGAVVFHALSEGMHGSSFGKMICGLTVISEGNKRCSMLQALGRSAAFYIDSMFFGVVASMNMSDSQMRQRLGDKWCKTVVCKRKTVPAEIKRSGWRFFWVLCLAFIADAFIQAIGLALHMI